MQKEGSWLPRKRYRFKGWSECVLPGLFCPATFWCCEPVTSSVHGFKPETSCRFKCARCWMRSLIARLWVTRWFWRTWVSWFLQGLVLEGKNANVQGATISYPVAARVWPATLGIGMAPLSLGLVAVPRKFLWLGRRPGSMPAGESPLISPGVPQVPFVTSPYEPLLMEVVLFGQGPFPYGRSLHLRACPLCLIISAKGVFVPIEGTCS